MVTDSAEATEPRQVKEPRVYLFDRDDDVRDSLKLLLESNGIAVRAFASQGEFLGATTDQPADCLILGFNRLIVEGLDLLGRLRRCRVETPAIFIVGGGDALTRASALSAGADAYLERPIKEETLMRAIRNALPQEAARERVRPMQSRLG